MHTAIWYTVAMPEPHTHLYHVSIHASALNATQAEFTLPSWTPGSYLVRNFARHVQEFYAEDRHAQALPWRKIAKDRWQVDVPGATDVRIHYKVYAYELTVRTSHLDDSHGFFNGTNLLMYLDERLHEPLGLRVLTPAAWQVTCGLDAFVGADPFPDPPAGSRATLFLAQDYDELVDCPVECGTHRLLRFEVGGKEHRIAIWGQGNEDQQRIVADTRRIVEQAAAMFGELPYKHYTFLLHLADGRGGLEHRNSVTNLLDRWSFRAERSYERFLALQSHEFFHVWNVKRIRAAPLGPFDYRRENYTRQLWAMEGITSYYDTLLLRRAGLIAASRYREIVAEAILHLHSQPGRQVQSLEQSSFDAWIKFYLPDENSANSSISYYLKGSLVALLLDLAIRERSAGTRSLDDVLRLLYERYPINRPGIPEDGGFQRAVEEVAGGDWSAFFAETISSTRELEYDRYLATVGLRLDWGYREPRAEGAGAWLGLRIDARNKITQVLSGSPAALAGIYAGDELLAFAGWRVNEQTLAARLAERTVGETVELSVFRREQLLQRSVTLGAAPYDRLALVALAEPGLEQRRQYAQWLQAELE